MLIQLQDGKPTGNPVLESNFKQLFPGTSFPTFLTPSDVEPLGFGMYDFTSQPTPGKYQKAVEVEPVKDSQGIYRQTWAIVSMTEAEQLAEDQRKAEEVRAQIIDATQKRLDDFAHTRNYDGILSACTYATSAVPKFATEGQYCVEVRDTTWAALYDILEEVQAGTRPKPSGYADIEDDLPVLTWP